MKILNINLILIATFITSVFYGQEIIPAENEEFKSTTHKTVISEADDGTIIPYKILIEEQRKYFYSFEGSKDDLNANRIVMPAYVTKKVWVDKNADNHYDEMFIIRYKKSLDDSFKIVTTSEGLGVKVDKSIVKSIDEEGVYFTENNDDDYFIVEEINML